MRETQQNIKRYKKQLLDVKSKIAAAGLFFLMSCLMMTTATFAWITLSMAPEVSNISTTITGNGNLEIALVGSDQNGTAKKPEESKVGDSKLGTIEKNLTWGNLINLNDKGYGLDKLILRPAALNSDEIMTSPLYAMQYDSDGRIYQSSFDFAYSSYDVNENKFLISNITRYGVRAISSKILSTSDTEAKENINKINSLKSALKNSTSSYDELVKNPKYITSLEKLMGYYLTDRFNSGHNSLCDEYITDFYDMIFDFKNVLYELGDFYVLAVNIQVEKKGITTIPNFKTFDELKNNNTFNTEEKLVAQAKKDNDKTILVNGFNQLLSEIKLVEGVLVDLAKEINEKDEDGNGATTGVYMNEITPYINKIVDISTTLIYIDLDGKGMKGYTIAQISGLDYMDLLKLLRQNLTYPAKIKGGALKRYEQLTGATIEASVTIHATKYDLPIIGDFDANVKAVITTDAGEEEPYIIPTLINGTESSTDNSIYDVLFADKTYVESAGDVYGMAIDLWFRTNIENSYLTLEGEPDIMQLPLKTKDGYYVYTDKKGVMFYHKTSSQLDSIDENTFDKKIREYQNTDVNIDKVELGYLQFQQDLMTEFVSGTFYNYESGNPLEFIDNPKTEEREDIIDRKTFIESLRNFAISKKVIGYNGENRVWEETTNLRGTSVTQGKGSCFIFYPKDPLEQESMLRVLSALTVTFITPEGDVLATANLNSEEAYSDSGKVIVPLQLDENTLTIINSNDEVVHYINKLEQNVTTMISAIVYLDGKMITNQDVSATKNINGYLNLQFGSSEPLESVIDDKLHSSFIEINASIPNENEITFDISDLPDKANSTIKVDIEGLSPSEVRLNFTREVNNFQGVKMDDLVLRKISEGDNSTSWNGTQKFTMPGKYTVKSVWIDGIEYELKNEITVNITGFGISNVSWYLNGKPQDSKEVYIMDSNSFYPISIETNLFGSDKYEPNSVEAIFKSEYSEYVTIPLSNLNSVWSGSSSFKTSGTYVLEYFKINNELFSVPSEMQKTAHVTLGIYADVQLQENVEFEWSPDDDSNNIVKIKNVYLYDNKGNILNDLKNVKIQYRKPGANDSRTSNLNWNGKSYSGEFLITEPGVYSFYRITIGDKDQENIVTNARAKDIIAKSPFEVKFNGTSVNYEEYQFAPNKDAGVSVQIQNSATGLVVAKFINIDKSKEIFIEGEIENQITYENKETLETWKFIPKYKNEKNEFVYDGEWQIDTIYISDVFHKAKNDNLGKYYNSGIGEKNYDSIQLWGQGANTKNCIIWDVDNVNFNVLTNINVNITSNYPTDENKNAYTNVTSIFTDSLNGKYYVKDFNISYSNCFKTDLSNETLKKYGVEFLTNHEKFGLKINYEPTYYTWWKSSADKVKETTVDSGIKHTIDSFDTNISNQLVKFDKKINLIEFKYPGTYTSSTNLVMKYNNTEHVYTVNSNTSYGENDFIHVTYDIPTLTLDWARPYAKFTNVSTNSASMKDTKKEQHENVLTVDQNNTDGYYTHVSAYFDCNRPLGWITGITLPTVTTELVNVKSGNNFNSASISILNGNGSSGNYKNVDFTFTPQSISSIANIGNKTDSFASASGYLVQAGSKATYVEVIDLYDNKYIFKLEFPLTVDVNQ